MDKVKKISPEQNEMLFEFTRKHYVEYYDLQNELADHLANAIEERWLIQPNLSFNEALHLEFKKFGVFGFMGVVESRQLALTKKYNKLIWGYMKQFIKLPQILITLACFMIAYKAIQFNVVFYQIFFFATFLLSLGVFITKNKKYRKKVKQTGRKWLFEEILMNFGQGSWFIYFPTQFWILFDLEAPGPVWIAVMAGVLVFNILAQYVVIFIIANRAEEHLLKTYPEYNM